MLSSASSRTLTMRRLIEQSSSRLSSPRYRTLGAATRAPVIPPARAIRRCCRSAGCSTGPSASRTGTAAATWRNGRPRCRMPPATRHSRLTCAHTPKPWTIWRQQASNWPSDLTAALLAGRSTGTTVGAAPQLLSASQSLTNPCFRGSRRANVRAGRRPRHADNERQHRRHVLRLVRGEHGHLLTGLIGPDCILRLMALCCSGPG